MKKSRIFLGLSVLALCSGAFILPAKAQPTPTAVQQTATSVAVVESIDYTSREVLLSGPSGNLVTVTAGPAVRNLDKVKVGDKVVLTYSEAVAAQVSPPGGTLPAPSQEVGALRAARGELPAGATYSVIDVHVTVTAVDKATNTVSFTRADGSSGTIEVKNPSMQKFAQGLKPGDNVELQYLQALTILVQK
jgi:hypothetical protein